MYKKKSIIIIIIIIMVQRLRYSYYISFGRVYNKNLFLSMPAILHVGLNEPASIEECVSVCNVRQMLVVQPRQRSTDVYHYICTHLEKNKLKY